MSFCHSVLYQHWGKVSFIIALVFCLPYSITRKLYHISTDKRWADAILYFKKHMGPTLLFHPPGPSRQSEFGSLSEWLSSRACVQILVSLLVSCVALDTLHKHSLPNLPPWSYVPHRVFVKIMWDNLCREFSRKIRTWKE